MGSQGRFMGALGGIGATSGGIKEFKGSSRGSQERFMIAPGGLKRFHERFKGFWWTTGCLKSFRKVSRDLRGV